MATYFPVASENFVEMHDMFDKETEYFRRIKHCMVVTEEEFAFRWTTLELELTRIKCWHDLKRQDISKKPELMRDEELLKEIQRQIKKLGQWERELDGFKRKRFLVDGLSKLI